MWRIRPATHEDLELLCEHNAAMALETEKKHLDRETLRAGCRALLGDSARGAYWLAEDDGGRAVGQLMLTYEWSDWRNGTFWWIQSVYVVPERRRQGVYRALYDSVQQRARAAEKVCGLRLYVFRDNETAKATYEALGMRAYGYEIFETEL